MNEQEIDIIESARSWIAFDVHESDNSVTRKEGEKLIQALDDIILKHQNNN